MKYFLKLLPAATLALLLSATPSDTAQAQSHEHGHKHGQASHEAMHGQAAGDEAAQPALVDGVQVVEITVSPAGYSTGRIALQAGVPARLVFTRTVDNGCLHQVQIPDLGIEATELPLNEAVAIEFTPEAAGEYTFACGMNMMKGMLLVRSS